MFVKAWNSDPYFHLFVFIIFLKRCMTHLLLLLIALLVAAKLSECHLTAVAHDAAQTPWERLEGAGDDVCLLECKHELVENLTRLGG